MSPSPLGKGYTFASGFYMSALGSITFEHKFKLKKPEPPKFMGDSQSLVFGFNLQISLVCKKEQYHLEVAEKVSEFLYLQAFNSH